MKFVQRMEKGSLRGNKSEEVSEPQAARQRRAASTTSMKYPHSCALALAMHLLSWGSQGAPVSHERFVEVQGLRLWNEIDDLCSSFLSANPKPQDSEDKGQSKRFLFHYSKTHDSGNSDFMSPVLHPLLQLMPELHERRMKKGRGEEEYRGPGLIPSRGYFLFRPRNGRSSSTFR
ncbi:neuromedin-U [Rhinoraja longicauda]